MIKAINITFDAPKAKTPAKPKPYDYKKEAAALVGRYFIYAGDRIGYINEIHKDRGKPYYYALFVYVCSSKTPAGRIGLRDYEATQTRLCLMPGDWNDLTEIKPADYLEARAIIANAAQELNKLIIQKNAKYDTQRNNKVP